MVRRLIPLIGLALFLASGCAGSPTAVVEPTLVQVTALPTDTSEPPLATSESTDTPVPPTETPVPAPTDTPELTPPTLAEQMDEFLTAETEAGRFSGAALVAGSDEVILAKGYGFADSSSGVPNATGTIFPLGTMTMPFTAVAILQLQEQGLLSISDSICDYVDECPPAWNEVELRHLLMQSSGISGVGTFLEYDVAADRYLLPKTVAAQTQNDTLLYKPGSRFEAPISQSDFLLLGLVIEKVSGESYEHYLQENIFDPLGMTSTRLGRTQDVSEGEFANGNKGSGTTTRNLAPLFSGAGLTSSIDDMYRWGQGLLSGALVSDESSELLFSSNAPVGNMHTGYGWFTGRLDGHFMASMVGIGASGFLTDITVFAEDNLMWVLLTNDPNTDTAHIGDTLIRMMFAED